MFGVSSSAVLAMLAVGAATATAIETPVLRGAASAFNGVASEYSLVERTASSSTKEAKHSCPVPPPFSPNQMYDVSAMTCDKGRADLDMWDIETALFRLVTVQSNRIFQTERLWCFTRWQRDGVRNASGSPYKFVNFAVHVISLLDVVQQLQLLPQECIDRHEPLRELLLPSRDTSGITKENVTSFEKDEATDLAWWEDEFFPTVTSAFSCGFTEEDEDEDRDILPEDIRDHFFGNKIIQQVWRLTKGYLRSPQKQRENNRRQQDFDVSLYVPFLPVPMSRVNLGEEARNDRTRGGSLRSGMPQYQGPAIWFLWHTIAARVAEMENECGLASDGMEKILSTVTNMVTYFGMTHPCPYCRDHFRMRVSRNDRHWTDLGNLNEVTRGGVPTGESALYPLEWLFVGGADGANLEDKVASISDGDSLMLFFWKMHNAVSSSTTVNYECKSEELADKEAFACTSDKSNVQYGGTKTTTRLIGRAWPTATRFRHSLQDRDTFDDARDKMERAQAELRALDREFGPSLRDEYWTEGADKEASLDESRAVMDAIERLDESILETGLLYTEYALDSAPSCDALEESIDSFEPLDVPSPLVDGNFAFLPDYCIDVSKREADEEMLSPELCGTD